MLCKKRWSLAVPTGTMEYQEPKDHSIWPDSSLFRGPKNQPPKCQNVCRVKLQVSNPPTTEMSKGVIVAGFPTRFFPKTSSDSRPRHSHMHSVIQKIASQVSPRSNPRKENRHRSPVIKVWTCPGKGLWSDQWVISPTYNTWDILGL